MYYFDVSSFLGSNRWTVLGQSGTKRALTEVRASQTVNTVAEKDVQIPIYQATAGDVQRLGTGRRIVRILVALTIAGGMGVLAAWGIIEGRSQAAREAERAGPVQAPLRVLSSRTTAGSR